MGYRSMFKNFNPVKDLVKFGVKKVINNNLSGPASVVGNLTGMTDNVSDKIADGLISATQKLSVPTIPFFSKGPAQVAVN
jgi:hypothetical protein